MTVTARDELKIKGITVRNIEEMSGKEYLLEIFKGRKSNLKMRLIRQPKVKITNVFRLIII